MTVLSPSATRPVAGWFVPPAAPVLAPMLPAIGKGGAVVGAGIAVTLGLTKLATDNAQQLWEYLNQRPGQGYDTLPDGDYVFDRSGACYIEWTLTQGGLKTFRCSDGALNSDDHGQQSSGSHAHIGRGWRVSRLGAFSKAFKCEPGTDVLPDLSKIESVGPGGEPGTVASATLGGTFFRPWQGGPSAQSLTITTMLFDGVPLVLPSSPVNPTVIPPEVEPVPDEQRRVVPAPKISAPAPMIAPLPRVAPSPGAPETDPSTQPDGQPETPGRSPVAPPIVRTKPVVPVPGTAPGSKPGPGGDELDGKGELKPKPKPEVTTRPTWEADYGTGPIGSPAQQPRPTPVGIATELGRLEEKAAALLQAPAGGLNILDAIEAILTFLASMADGAPGQEYRLYEGCPSPPGADRESRTVTVPETSDNQSSMLVRFDAVMEMLQAHKDLRGPICRGRRPEGVGVTVNFRSLGTDGASGRALRKRLSYRDPTGGSLAAHTSHWSGFQWSAGPVVISHDESRMGPVKVWAQTEAEGMRVIRHAASAAGVDADVEGVWGVVVTDGSRLGRSGTMAPQVVPGGGIAVTVRDGSSGSPVVLTDS